MIKQTQTFLKYFLGLPANFAIDGIQGDQTNQAIRDAITKLQRKFANEKMIWNSEFNFIGIRTSNEFTDLFSDWFIVYAYGTIIAVPASTCAGLSQAKRNATLNVGGITGVAILAPNQQIDYLLVQPSDTTFWNPNWTGGIGFLYQDQAVRIFRDNNGDSHQDYLQPQSGLFGINVHSWINFNGDYVDNLSQGCQVTQYWFWVPLFDLMKRFAENKRITYTLLQW
jgi:hypothetical protein